MNNEKIIIDGVNVGQCKYLNTFTDCDGYHYYCDLADDIKNEYCEYYKDCYFKQLQQEKFENLNNRQMVESAENLIYENSELIKNLKEKEQECEELKEIISDFISDNRTMYCYDDRQPVTLEEIQECMEFTYNAGLKYKQTLDEIEKKCCAVLNGDEKILYAYQIKEIINKAKDTTNET